MRSEVLRRELDGRLLPVAVRRSPAVSEALAEGAGLILLDNMNLADMRAAVALARGYPGAGLEASGGLQLANARTVAQTGVDFLSVGSLTHSSPALDLGIDLLDR